MAYNVVREERDKEAAKRPDFPPREGLPSYSLGRQLVPKVLYNVFLDFHRLLGCTAAAVRAAQASKGNFHKTFYKTFGTSYCPRLYFAA